MKMNEHSNPNYTIIEVWSSNLEEEFKKIRKIVQKYPYVAMVSRYSVMIQSKKVKSNIFEKSNKIQ